MKIIVSGYMIRKPVVGLAWHYGQYLLGLTRLGHEVLYVEDNEDLTGDAHESLPHASRVFHYLGLETDWCFHDYKNGEWLGPARGRVAQALIDSDVLISLSGPLALFERFERIPLRIMIDTDPVFTQAKTATWPGWAARCASHHAFFTFGENYGRPDCGIPRDGFPWKATRQPIVLDRWNRNLPRAKRGCSTIMSWKSYAPTCVDGVRYGLKDDSFGQIMDLPTRTSVQLEIALDADVSVRDRLREAGWSIKPAAEVSRNIAVYRDYIRTSLAEFAVVKSAYVTTKSGWFSERSACYLAAGRPVITENTGFSTWLESGLGVLAYDGGDQALAAIDDVQGAYEAHSRAARDIASEYFDSDRVLSSLLESAASSESLILTPGSLGEECLNRYCELRNAIDSVVPSNAGLIVIDDQAFGLFGYLGDRSVIPFLERDGVYWGAPIDSAEAIENLISLRSRGWCYLVIAPEGQWWTDHYEEFSRYLLENCEMVLDRDDLQIFRLADLKCEKDKVSACLEPDPGDLLSSE